jgi:hypothetical protein
LLGVSLVAAGAALMILLSHNGGATHAQALVR